MKEALDANLTGFPAKVYWKQIAKASSQCEDVEADRDPRGVTDRRSS